MFKFMKKKIAVLHPITIKIDFNFSLERMLKCVNPEKIIKLRL